MALGPLPDVDNVARVRLNGTAQSADWVALFYWHYMAGTVTSSDMIGLALLFIDTFRTHMAPAFDESVSISSADAWDLSNRSGAQGSATGTAIGTRIGTPNPVNIAAVTSWKVNYRWRGGHPRTYWPAGVTSDIVGGNLWTDTAVSAFAGAANSWLAAVNAGIVAGQGGYLTCVRYVYTPTPGQPPVYFDPPLDLRIQSAQVDKRLDTQRRRLGPDL